MTLRKALSHGTVSEELLAVWAKKQQVTVGYVKKAARVGILHLFFAGSFVATICSILALAKWVWPDGTPVPIVAKVALTAMFSITLILWCWYAHRYILHYRQINESFLFDAHGLREALQFKEEQRMPSSFQELIWLAEKELVKHARQASRAEGDEKNEAVQRFETLHRLLLRFGFADPRKNIYFHFAETGSSCGKAR